MLSPVEVRRATIEDAEAVARTLAAVAPEGLIATEPPVDLAQQAARMRGVIEAGAPAGMWVLEAGGRVVGCAGAHPTGAAGVVSLGMALLPEARGRGGGRMLMDAVLAHAAEHGAHKIELEVWPENGRAIAFYVAAGFAVEGLRRDHYRRRDGSLRSSLLMARPVGDRP